MINKILSNNHIYAWRVDLQPAQFLHGLSIFRYMNNSYRTGLQRVIFSGPFYKTTYGSPGEFINDWPIDCSIELHYVDYNRPDDYTSGYPLVKFSRCIPLRSWIPHLIVENPNRAGVLLAYIDVECFAKWYTHESV